MIFNLDLSKQVKEVILSRKIKKLLHPTFLFNNIPLNNSPFQKQLGLALEIKVNLSEHIKNITKKLVKLWVFYVNLSQFYQGHLFSRYIKPL